MQADTSANECADCSTGQFLIMDHISGDCICSQCGQVLEMSCIDNGQEWRDSSDGQTLKGTNKDVSRGSCSNGWGDMYTHLGHGASDAMRHTHAATHAVGGIPRSHRRAYLRILKYCRLISVDSQVSSRCYDLVTRYAGCSKKGTRCECIIAALYLVCRMERVPFGLTDLVRICTTIASPHVTEKAIRRQVMTMQVCLNKADPSALELLNNLTPEDFVTKFVNRLNLGDSGMNIEKMAFAIMAELPSSLPKIAPLRAAVAICCAARFETGEDLDVDDVASTLNLKETSLRRLFKDASKACVRFYAPAAQQEVLPLSL
eukprot:GEMP01012681.1.p1 GENE.GEMP01012681.1~~GEMP01012681.1.p1  ORF type:complete len:317 (+),score=36.22 GEMP01012681.1:85-1035(+)